MNPDWLPHGILRVASLLAPADQRAGWLEEWKSELFYIPRRRTLAFCLGAFRDALWLRRHNLTPRQRLGLHPQSPLACILLLSAIAALSLLVSVSVRLPHLQPEWDLKARDIPAACAAMLLLSGLLLPATWLAMRTSTPNPHPMQRRGAVRRAAFLALKFLLLQPIVLCTFVVLMPLVAVVPFLAQPGIAIIWALAFRWVLIDQRHRCPVCLRVLTNPVRIGTPSTIFLDWYGAESMCSRGHGLLQVPGAPAISDETEQWVSLDGSWKELFAGTRQ